MGWSSAGAPQLAPALFTRMFYVAHALQGLVGQAGDVGILGAVGSHPAGVDTGGLQLGTCGFQFVCLARGDHHLGTGLAQGVCQLQAQAARSAGDQGGLSSQVKKLLNGTCHGRCEWLEV